MELFFGINFPYMALYKKSIENPRWLALQKEVLA
jgi:hypothetical protein